MRTGLVIAVSLFLSLCGLGASAATYNFNVLYSGNGVGSLVTGSANPVGVNLQPGDSFIWNIQAVPNSFWEVVTGGSFYPFMGFLTDTNAARTGNFMLDLSFGGTSVSSVSGTGVTNGYSHVGTNSISLAQGIKFNDMQLNYTLSKAESVIIGNGGSVSFLGTAADTKLQSILPAFGTPEMNPYAPGVTFTQAVPEPETYAMMLAGLGLIGAIARRRRGAAT